MNRSHTQRLTHLVTGSLLIAPLLGACSSTPDYTRELADGASPLIPLESHEPMPNFAKDWETRDEALPALDQSIDWMRRAHSRKFFPAAGISHERTLASLLRFRELLLESTTPTDFQRDLREEFQVYKSAGWNGRGGGVLFTAYCTPILQGSVEPMPGFDYPLYALPPDLSKASDGTILGWETALGRLPSYPSRGAIEAGGLLEGKGLELVWLRDPIDAYIAHVNGSAFILLTDGSMLRLGYSGKNGRPYRSLGKELEADREIERGTASLAAIREWAANSPPEKVQEYLARNESFVFFTPIDGNPHGSLDVEVTAERSIATDKTLFPRAAIVFVEPAPDTATTAPVNHFYFDQDTGGAIRTAGRADLYLGVGDDAERVAGETKLEGQMYYLFLK